MSVLSPEWQAKIANIRARMAGQGAPVELEEYREAVRHLRGERTGALQAQVASKGRARKQAVVPDADSMLDEML